MFWEQYKWLIHLFWRQKTVSSNLTSQNIYYIVGTFYMLFSAQLSRQSFRLLIGRSQVQVLLRVLSYIYKTSASLLVIFCASLSIKIYLCICTVPMRQTLLQIHVTYFTLQILCYLYKYHGYMYKAYVNYYFAALLQIHIFFFQCQLNLK